VKIQRGDKRADGFIPIQNKHFAEVRHKQGSSFDQELNRRQTEFEQVRMQEILAEIDKINADLRKKLTLKDLMLYKKKVRDFLQVATACAYRLQKEKGRHRRGRTLLLTIKTIDYEVEKMIADFVAQKNEPVDVLANLDKIRGMLLDCLI